MHPTLSFYAVSKPKFYSVFKGRVLSVSTVIRYEKVTKGAYKVFRSFPALPSAMRKIPRRNFVHLRKDVIKMFKMKFSEQERLKVLHRLFKPAVTVKTTDLHGVDRKLGFSMKKAKEMAKSG